MQKTRKFSGILLLLFGFGICFVLTLSSCKDDYLYDNAEPDFLEQSIYDYLEQRGDFKYFLLIIDEMQYKDVLKKTGSKTLFVANDDAFERFFKNNPYGIKSFETMTHAQKASILNFGMINNAYLLEMLANTTGTPPAKGQAMRRYTAMIAQDTIPFESGSYLPDNKYWGRFVEKGIYVMNDNTSPTMVHFLESQMRNKGVTDQDFSIIFNGKTRSSNDAHIFGIRVLPNGATKEEKHRDIACKNGYVNVLEDVLYPPMNMAQYIRTNPKTKIFNRLLERFCAPYYGGMYSVNGTSQDSVFVKRFFTKKNSADPTGKLIANLLTYDPGQNSLTRDNVNFQIDMSAMFVPSDDAMNEYFNVGKGKFLKDRYGSWDNVPDNIIAIFLNNHMKSSFLETLPSKFSTVKNDAGYLLGVKESDLETNNTYVGTNGIVYVVNTVYPPTEYASVMAPILVSEKTKVFNWAIKQLQFDLYLLSMDSKKFSFMVPTDDYLNDYIDPVSQGYVAPKQKQTWKFYYDEKTVSVIATIYNANGDSIGRMTDKTTILNRLQDILDYHVVVGDIEDGKEFYITKGGGHIKVSGTGVGMKIYGGGNMEQNAQGLGDYTATVKDIQLADNGKTYMIDKQLQNPIHSVYFVLKNNPDFNEFFKLADGVGDIFYLSEQVGLDFNVKFFNTYHYTIYVPTNQAVIDAITAGLIPTIEEIDNETDLSVKTAKQNKLRKFLRYHFQDNSAYLDKNAFGREYETAALNNTTQKFYTIGVTNDGTDTYLTTNTGQTVKILKTAGLYDNIMARDYKFNTNDRQTSTQISTSSRAVIHQVDQVLRFE